jgi:hypothetical protein
MRVAVLSSIGFLCSCASHTPHQLTEAADPEAVRDPAGRIGGDPIQCAKLVKSILRAYESGQSQKPFRIFAQAGSETGREMTKLMDDLAEVGLPIRPQDITSENILEGAEVAFYKSSGGVG